MPKSIIVLLVILLGWYAQTHTDFSKFKASCIELFKKDKTINTVNSTRARTQEDVYKVTGERE